VNASFHLGGLLRDMNSTGINIGFNPEQTAAPGGSRAYRFFADSANIESAIISDFGGDDTGVKGLYGAVVVAPEHATFVDPVTSAPKDIGAQVDVRVPGQKDYRDFSVLFSENDPFIGSNTMPYPSAVGSHATVNYQSAGGRALDGAQFSSLTNGDPSTPLLRAYPGDAMRIHVIGAPGGEQGSVFNLGGHTWSWDPGIPRAEQLANQNFGPLSTIDAHVRGGAGSPGDYFYGNIRRPFTDAGQWGLLRVLQPGAGPIRALAVSPPLQAMRPRTPLSRLSLAKGYSAATLRAKGLAFGLRGDSDVRVVRVKLYRIGGKRPVLAGSTLIQVLSPAAKAKLSKRALARRSKLSVSAAGVIRATWRPSPVLLRALRAGRYRLDVQAGPGTTTIDKQTLRGGTRVTIPPTPKAG
jgi:hypothetical protein